ncbi:hypothetical protein [Rhizohabitans arisaemae]|uniref:hypothetical protein n=1 Tax=Rhizohabitans arisaemae TaxID=2720610 RepID=UPI0024B08D28|nr:hypothetical protein [Rhizohabitans arisaemae]
MGLFRRALPAGGEVDEVVGRLLVDRPWEDLDLDDAVELVVKGRLTAGLHLLTQTRHDHETRVLRVGALAEAAVGRSAQLASLCADDPGDPDGWLWLGCTMLAEAWAARGRGYTATVSDDDYEVFYAALEASRHPLLEAASLAPSDAAPWVLLQAQAKAMGLDRTELDAIWSEVERRCPSHFEGARERLQAMCKKWYGSHKEMFHFAREVVARAPRGHPATAMIVLAHFECLEYDLSELPEEVRADRTPALVRSYFTEEVLAEIREADEKWSMWASAHPYGVSAHHLFGAAYLCGPGGAYSDRARVHLSKVGGRWQASPWEFLSEDPERAFAAALVQLGLEWGH